MQGHHKISSAAVEDYTKAIYALEARGGSAVSITALAQRLGVTPAAASAMVKKLAARELIEHEPYREVSLTPAGRRVALGVIRHHRLLETFLSEELGMPWDRVHREAEVLEHVVSEELVALIAAKLGNPARDPHGDPIPTAELGMHEGSTQSLGTLEPGSAGTFVRVSDSDPAMLRYLAERGIAPGDRLEVVEQQPFGGPTVARFGADADVHALGGALARAMRVQAPVAEDEPQDTDHHAKETTHAVR